MTLDGQSIRKRFSKVDWTDTAVLLIVSAIIASLLKSQLEQATFTTFLILWIYWIIFCALVYKTGILGQ